MSDKQHTNRLINEASPYLLQHANNPVDWYPWGNEAFEKARIEDKPVFLSIGYSTCHWCHVMAHESFESEEVAQVLNSGFVSIKVDREQRPDIDEVYMSVCQAMTGSGGWPLSVFMTADKQPFFAGTYFPKDTMHGRIGFIELCTNILKVWKEDKQGLLKNSEQLKKHFAKPSKRDKVSVDTGELIKEGYEYLLSSFEKKYGGFSYAPKFPSPHNLLFLLRYYKASGSKKALDMTEQTLMHMYRGGIFDHIGGGFSRYSTDSRWLVPHFEKMLYDNAMLLLAYSETYAITKNQNYADIIDKTCTYVLRDMQASQGGFYSAEDADSEGVEGKYYVFSYDELEGGFSKEEMHILEECFGVTERGNFEGNNIINRIGAELEDTEQAKAILKKLYELRDKRIRPFKDTKVSASWNGLMIEGLCRAGIVTQNSAYIDSAKKAADFMLTEMMRDGELFGIYKEGSEPTEAFLPDYANFANGLITLYSATLELEYLKDAVSLAKRMIAIFYDINDARFYMTREEGEELFFRPKDDYDGAMPSGNSSALMCLKSLYDITGDETFLNTLSSAVSSFVGTASKMPGAYIHILSLLQRQSAVHRQIVITGSGDKTIKETLLSLLREYMPFTTLIYYDGSDAAKEAFSYLPSYSMDEPFAAYICENFACQSPIYSPYELLEELGIER